MTRPHEISKEEIERIRSEYFREFNAAKSRRSQGFIRVLMGGNSLNFALYDYAFLEHVAIPIGEE